MLPAAVLDIAHLSCAAKKLNRQGLIPDVLLANHRRVLEQRHRNRTEQLRCINRCARSKRLFSAPMWRAIRTGKWLRFHGPRFPRQPTSLRITASVDSAHISSNRSFADFEAELQQFTLDLG